MCAGQRKPRKAAKENTFCFASITPQQQRLHATPPHATPASEHDLHTICILCSVRVDGDREGGRASVAMTGLVSFPKVILPALVGSSVASYIFWDLVRNRKIFGGTVPRTIQGSEWENETNRKLDAWPREAAGPVVMNPISRQNYHKA